MVKRSKFNLNHLVLILDSCIAVHDNSFVKRNDTQTRLEDYKRALRLWLTKQRSIKKIVFCDNSGYSLEALKEVVRQHGKGSIEVEFLSYHLTDYQGKGYGWGLAHLHDHAMKHSNLLSNADYLISCTGRYYIKNIDRICQSLPKAFDFVVNLTHNLTSLECGCLFVKIPLYRDVFTPATLEYTSSRTKSYFGRVLAKVALKLIADDAMWFPLPYQPLYDGVFGQKNIRASERGFVGKSFTNWIGSLANRFAYRTRQTVYDHTKRHFVHTLATKTKVDLTEKHTHV